MGWTSAPVEGGKDPLACDRETEQVDIGELLCSLHYIQIEPRAVGQAKGTRPELVSVQARPQLVEQAHRRSWRDVARVGWRARNPAEPVFGKRAGGPADALAAGVQPAMSTVVVDVRRVYQRQQDADIEQVGHTPSSSRIR